MRGLLCLLMSLPLFASAADLTIAAASNYRLLLDDVVQRFEKSEKVEVSVIYGSSGKLATQIQHGAPYDLYFSANAAYMTRLEQAGELAGMVITDGYGQLALLAAEKSEEPFVESLDTLLKEKAIAIAQPRHAPFGQAAVSYLESNGLYERVNESLVYAENVAQVMHMVRSGAAEYGFVALSLIKQGTDAAQRLKIIPLKDKSLLKQQHAVIAGAKNTELATRFSQFMQQPEITQLKRRYGIEPENDDVNNGAPGNGRG